MSLPTLTKYHSRGFNFIHSCHDALGAIFVLVKKPFSTVGLQKFEMNSRVYKMLHVFEFTSEYSFNMLIY